MAKTKISFTDYTPKDVHEVFSTINTRQITALMFHDEMSDLFDFLGLKGFKRLHEYQYLSESIEHRHLKKHYLNCHGMLLADEELTPIDVIPDDWYQYTRTDVTSAIRQQYVQKAMNQYKEWESGTKDLYEKCAACLIAWGNVSDFNKVNDLVKDVSTELKYLERLCIELKSVDYDSEYIESIQDCYHKEYKKKLKSLGKLV